MPTKLSKKNVTIFICCVIIIAFALQSCGKTYYIFGALTKSNLYAYSPDNIYNNQGGVDWYPKVGVQLGVGTNITDIKKKFCLRTEVNTSYQGAGYEDVSNFVTGDINLLYAYVPLIVKYKSKSKIFVETGFQPGLLISAKDRIGGSSTYFSDYVNNLDIGITGAIGYEINNKFSIALMGYLGFINVSEAKTDAKNNTVLSFRGTYTLKKNRLSKSEGI
jgi:hypothetical protein